MLEPARWLYHHQISLYIAREHQLKCYDPAKNIFDPTDSECRALTWHASTETNPEGTLTDIVHTRPAMSIHHSERQKPTESHR